MTTPTTAIHNIIYRTYIILYNAVIAIDEYTFSW